MQSHVERTDELRSRAFFRSIIATADPDQIIEALATMEKNREAIDNDVNTLVFYMNGGLDYDDAWLLTSDQRVNLARVIERHFKTMNPNSKQQM